MWKDGNVVLSLVEAAARFDGPDSFCEFVLEMMESVEVPLQDLAPLLLVVGVVLGETHGVKVQFMDGPSLN